MLKSFRSDLPLKTNRAHLTDAKSFLFLVIDFWIFIVAFWNVAAEIPYEAISGHSQNIWVAEFFDLGYVVDKETEEDSIDSWGKPHDTGNSSEHWFSKQTICLRLFKLSKKKYLGRHQLGS